MLCDVSYEGAASLRPEPLISSEFVLRPVPTACVPRRWARALA